MSAVFPAPLFALLRSKSKGRPILKYVIASSKVWIAGLRLYRGPRGSILIISIVYHFHRVIQNRLVWYLFSYFWATIILHWRTVSIKRQSSSAVLLIRKHNYIDCSAENIGNNSCKTRSGSNQNIAWWETVMSLMSALNALSSRCSSTMQKRHFFPSFRRLPLLANCFIFVCHMGKFSFTECWIMDLGLSLM